MIEASPAEMTLDEARWRLASLAAPRAPTESLRGFRVASPPSGGRAPLTMRWIDTHCHLDAAEFDPDRAAVWQRARMAGVTMVVIPAIAAPTFDGVRALAHELDVAYALGIHPLCTNRAEPVHLEQLQDALRRHAGDPRLVAVGEIGLDWFVPGFDRERQQHFYVAQLKLARDAGLPVLLHVRRSADGLAAGLRRVDVPGGIAHAFNGSAAQAEILVAMGLKLGFGGAMTFDRAQQIRRIAASVPDHAPVLETDAPDIPPHWLYRTATQREQGEATQRNEPAELPRIAATLAELRGWSLADTAAITAANARAALPRLAALMNAA
jgi:TatD DNase family protein